jgi:hypothetical protein
VHRRLTISLLLGVLLALFSPPALAQQYPRDAAASRKIDEAVNQQYLATNFEKAEGVLLGTIKACEDKCSPATLAKAWMYVGIVRGSGKGDLKGAQEAFAQAIAINPEVALDAALATPETQKAFQDAGGSGAAQPPGGAGAGGKKPPVPAGDEAGEMECTPDVREVQTHRPIPVSCLTEDEATKAEIKYKEFGGDRWQTVKMRKTADGFQGEIPCTATATAGTLRVYVTAKDAAGDTIDNWGNKGQPVELQIVPETSADPPSYPDRDPPARCAAKEICPPDFPGCGATGAKRGTKGWGATCEGTIECEAGLVCANGACEQAPSCDSDADCSAGKCVGGYCDPTAGEGGGAVGPYKKNWIGLHVAQDFALVGGDDVCSPESQANNGFACFQDDGFQYIGFPQPGTANRIQSGMALATTRFLLSYDRVLLPNITIGARAGYAIGGGPAPEGGAAFLPIHAELRGAYWFGSNPFGSKGLRPYVHAGGGMAQVDAKLEVTLLDCSSVANAAGGFDEDIHLDDPNDPRMDPCLNAETGDGFLQRRLDAYKKLGQGFATIGGGAVYAFAENMGVQLNLNLMVMLPSSGFVLEPSLGFVYGL